MNNKIIYLKNSEYLEGLYLSSLDVEEKCRDIIISYLENSIYDEGAIWYNEYCGIDRDDELDKKLINFRSTDDFKIVTMINTDHSALFFKIIPVKMRSRMTPFLGTQTTTNWDGYFIDVEREPAIKQELIQQLNQSCVNNTTQIVNGWGMDSDENYVQLTPRLEMYLAQS